MEIDPVRVIVYLNPTSENVITSPSSGIFVRGLFYKAISAVDKKLATHLHDANMKKPFSLTGLRARERKIDENGLLHLKPPVYFMFSTPYSILAEKFIDGLERLGEFEIPAARFTFSNAKVYPIRDTKFIKTKTAAAFRAANDKHYFELEDEAFPAALRYAMTRPIENYGGKIEDYSIKKLVKKIVTLDGKKVPAYHIEFTAEGDTALLKSIGLGNHTASGFGFLVE